MEIMSFYKISILLDIVFLSSIVLKFESDMSLFSQIRVNMGSMCVPPTL